MEQLQEWVKGVLYQPELIAPILGVAFGLFVSLVLHWQQRRHARVLPFLPSYQDAVTQEHDDSTRFFAAVHDLTMCITESWNVTHSRHRDHGTVERNISRPHLRAACEGVATHGRAMMDNLDDYRSLSSLIVRAHTALSAAWTYRSKDNYRTETYTVRRRDKDGKYRTETRTRRVYEDTDHWFTYTPQPAQEARDILQRLSQVRHQTRLVRPEIRRMRVGLDNLSEADRMFLEKIYLQTIVEDPDATPTQDELAAAANQWLLGTSIDADLVAFEQHMDHALKTCAAELKSVLDSRASYHYKTRSRAHTGPPGHQAAQRLNGRLKDSSSSWTKVSEMWTTCSEAAQAVLEWAEDSDTTEENRSYVEAVIRAYEAAFPHSTIEVDQLTSPGRTALIGLGMAVGFGTMVYVLHPHGPVF